MRGEEGCLSIPGFFGEVERSEWVRVEALDAEGLPLAFEAKGLQARVIQHEMDHLDGVLFIDRLPPVTRTGSRRRSRRTACPRTRRTTPSRSSGGALRVLFYGTPAFAVPTLEALLGAHHVVGGRHPAGPARRAGPACRRLAGEGARAGGRASRCLQPPRLRDAGWPERLAELGAEIAVVVAFGQILPKAVLDVPTRGSINIHASLLPRYRGAAPIAWAIIRGETETGITTIQMDPGMDTGDMLLREATPIGPGETAGELAARLAPLGAAVILRTLADLDALTPMPQDHGQATLAPRLKKEDGWLRLSQPAKALVDRVRGCNPWPGAALTAATTRAPHLARRGGAASHDGAARHAGEDRTRRHRGGDRRRLAPARRGAAREPQDRALGGFPPRRPARPGRPSREIAS